MSWAPALADTALALAVICGAVVAWREWRTAPHFIDRRIGKQNRRERRRRVRMLRAFRVSERSSAWREYTGK